MCVSTPFPAGLLLSAAAGRRPRIFFWHLLRALRHGWCQADGIGSTGYWVLLRLGTNRNFLFSATCFVIMYFHFWPPPGDAVHYPDMHSTALRASLGDSDVVFASMGMAFRFAMDLRPVIALTAAAMYVVVGLPRPPSPEMYISAALVFLQLLASYLQWGGHFTVFEFLDVFSRAVRLSGASRAVYLHCRHLSGHCPRLMFSRLALWYLLACTCLRKTIRYMAQRSTQRYLVVYDDGLLYAHVCAIGMINNK